MKGIVAQIEGKHAVVLTQDGAFHKVRAKPYMETGIEIDMDQPAGKVQSTRLIMKVTSIAAAALLTLGVGYGAYSYAMPYSYVHLDINPSIELTANVYDRIIKAEALNEDGQKLLEGKNLKNSSIETGVSDLLGIAVKKGYLGEKAPQSIDAIPGAADGTNTAGEGTGTTGVKRQPQEIDNAVVLTVSSNSSKKSGNLKKKIMDSASKELDNDKVDSEILVGETSIEQRNEARVLGVTPGKLALIEDAMEDEPQLQLDDLKNNSVEELLKKIQDKEKSKQENGNTGAKAGVKEQSSKEQASDKKPNSPVQPENTAILKNQGNGRVSGNSTSQKDQDQLKENEQTQQSGQGTQDKGTKTGSAGSSDDNKNRSANQTNNQSKSQTQNKNQNQNGTNKSYDDKDNGQKQTGTGVQGKGQNANQNEGTVNNRKEDNSKKTVTNNGEQAESGAGGGNSKKIDDADRKTAGKDANELKIERKQLRNDLLDQMEKQLKERNNIPGAKNTNSNGNNKNGGKSDVKRHK